MHGEGEVEAVAEKDHSLDSVLGRKAWHRPGQQLSLQCRLPAPGQTGAKVSLHLDSSTLEIRPLLQKANSKRRIC